MITISTLQSQIDLNRITLRELEYTKEIEQEYLQTLLRLIKQNGKKVEDFSSIFSTRKMISNLKKQIKQYAKLQRALKSELAYRIMYNREMRSNNMDNYQLK